MPFSIKVALFFVLWFELARCFGLSADGSFFCALLISYGVTIVAALNFELAGLEGELTALLVAWGVIWLALFVWLAPQPVKDVPISFVICAVVALVLIGQRSFDEFAKRPEVFTRVWLRDRSEAVVGAVLAVLGAAMICERRWGSVLPLIGYGGLIALPIAFGWRLGAHKIATPFDAVFGNRDTYRDSGVSEDQ